MHDLSACPLCVKGGQSSGGHLGRFWGGSPTQKLKPVPKKGVAMRTPTCWET